MTGVQQCAVNIFKTLPHIHLSHPLPLPPGSASPLATAFVYLFIQTTQTVMHTGCNRATSQSAAQSVLLLSPQQNAASGSKFNKKKKKKIEFLILCFQPLHRKPLNDHKDRAPQWATCHVFVISRCPDGSRRPGDSFSPRKISLTQWQTCVSAQFSPLHSTHTLHSACEARSLYSMTPHSQLLSPIPAPRSPRYLPAVKSHTLTPRPIRRSSSDICLSLSIISIPDLSHPTSKVKQTVTEALTDGEVSSVVHRDIPTEASWYPHMQKGAKKGELHYSCGKCCFFNDAS